MPLLHICSLSEVSPAPAAAALCAVAQHVEGVPTRHLYLPGPLQAGTNIQALAGRMSVLTRPQHRHEQQQAVVLSSDSETEDVRPLAARLSDLQRGLKQVPSPPSSSCSAT